MFLHKINRRILRFLHRSAIAPGDEVPLGYLRFDPDKHIDHGPPTDPLTTSANQIGIDKGTRIPEDGKHHGPRLYFTPIYDTFLRPSRHEPIKMIEIGIGSGGSLRMWHEYFSEAEIHAIDVMPHDVRGMSRIETHIADQSDRSQMRQISERVGTVDLVVDDGGHMMGQQQISLASLFPVLKPGGFYFIEDLHTSFWPHNGYSDLYGTKLDINLARTNTTIEYLETLLRTGFSCSEFLTDDENSYITEQTEKIHLFRLPETEYGPNIMALLIKRST